MLKILLPVILFPAIKQRHLLKSREADLQCTLSTKTMVCTFCDSVALGPAAVGHTPELVPVSMTVGVTRTVNCERTMASKNLFVPSLEQMTEDRVAADL